MDDRRITLVKACYLNCLVLHFSKKKGCAVNLKSVEDALPELLAAKKMLKILELIEKEALPQLLFGRSPDIWQSLYIDYEKPFVERLWCQLGPVRINLHKIHPCNEGEALFHPHPWPSAMHVLTGVYETAIGYAIWNETPEIALKGEVSGDFKYEMGNQNAWHYVRPISYPAYTVMVTGTPYKTLLPVRVGHKSPKPLRTLDQTEKETNLFFFWDYYLGDAWRAAKQ